MAARRHTSTRKSAAPRKTAAVKPATVAPVVRPGERLFVLSVPFDQRGVAAANGARWDAHTRQTIYVGPSLPYGLTPYAAQDYSWERYVEDDLNGDVLAPAAGPARMTPRPHQKVASDRIAEMGRRGWRGFVEADDVGLGKTLASLHGALQVAKDRRAQTMLIVCPKGVIPHWRNTLAAAGGAPGLRVVVINYDQAKKLLTVPKSAETAKKARTKNKAIANQGKPVVNWDIVLLDEAHKVKNSESQRSRAMARIARYADTAQKAPFVIWMSATIGQNPAELAYLSPLFAQVTGASKSALADFGQWLADEGFAVTWNGRFSKWEWGVIAADAPQSEIDVMNRLRERDLKRVNAMLFGADAPSIRRLPTDIAGWPEIQRIPAPVDLDLAERALYEQAWTEFRSAIGLAHRGRDPKGALAARTRFRQKASLIRVPGTVEHVMDLRDNGFQVAVCVEWIESLDAIRDALTKAGHTVAEFSGRNSVYRENERLAFQRGQASVILFTVVEGVSLHAGEQLPDGTNASLTPRATIVHDPRYSGLDSIQIEGRAHRDGQKSNVYYSYALGTVEALITRTLLGRIRTTKTMAGDDVSVLRELESILDGADDASTGPTQPGSPAKSVQPGPPVQAGRATPVRPVGPASAAPAVPGVRAAPPRAAADPTVTRQPVRPAARPAGDAGMTPEERAFREAMAGKRVAAATKRAPTVAERAALRQDLGRR